MAGPWESYAAQDAGAGPANDSAPPWQKYGGGAEQPKGFMSDVGTALKEGTQRLPGALTGLVDIPLGLAGMDRPVSRAAERLGEATGFQPGKWAEQTAQQYSPETQASRAEIDKAWADPDAGALDVAGAYLRNPRATALNVVQSVPSIVAGGVAGRVAGLAGLASAPARAALGEGAVMAGQQMDQIDDQVDPQRAAAAALGTGVVGAAAGAASGRIAARMGVRDLETTLAGGATGGAARAPGVVGRVAGGAGQEAAEEAAQSAVEQGAQNWAEGKDIGEGMARNIVEGSLAGGVMGAGAGAVPLSKRMGLDPNAGPLSAAAATAVDNGAAPLALPAPTVTVDGEGTARTADQRQAERDAPGPIETGAMGQGRNSEEVAAPAPFPSPEQQPALEYSAAPALGYDTAPTDTLIADADGSVRQETRAEAINRDQQQSEQQAVEDAEAQRRADLGLPPLTPVQQVRPGPARGETLELGADGVARPVDLLPEPTNRIRAGRAAREAGPGHEPVRVEGGWNVRRITPESGAGAAAGPAQITSESGRSSNGAAGEPGGLAAGAGAGRRADPGPGLGGAGRAQPGGSSNRLVPAAGGAVAAGQGDLAVPVGGADAAVAPRATADDGILAEAGKGGNRRISGLDYMEQDTTWRLEQALAYPNVNAQDQAENVAALRGRLAAIKAARPRAEQMDEADLRGEMQRGMLHGARQELDAAVKGGTMSADQARAAANVAGQTGNAVDASQSILDTVDHAAHAAATSPTNDRPEPSQAQKEAGNYAKGHLKLHGLDISIENPRGSTRSGTDPGGRPWSVAMPAHYGYVRRTTGADGDQVDVYIGDHPDSQRVFVVDQRDADTGKFDEHKVILGARNGLEARRLYNAGFSDGRGRERMGAVTPMSMEQFKAWLKGDTTKPAAPQAEATKLLDHGELNIPGRTNGINAALDRHKAAQAAEQRAERKTQAAQNREDKARAKELFAQHGEAIIAKNSNRFGRAQVAKTLDAMVKWEPRKFIQLAERFEREQAAGPVAEGGGAAAAAGRVVSRDAGQRGEGMSEFRAGQVRRQLAKDNPGTTYTVEEAPGLKNGWVVVGRAQGGDSPMSSAADGAASSARGQLRSAIQQAVDRAMAGWKNPPPVVVVANPNSPGVHPRVRDHYARPGEIVPNGSYFGGTVYLFTEQLQDGAEALRVLAHEALGHAGLRGFFGSALNGVLDQVATARAAQVRAKAEEYGLDIGNQRQRRMAAEELLAEMAEQNPQLPLVRRAIAAIRTWLRENIPAMSGLALSDAEIVRNFLLPARGFIERGPAAERAPSSVVPASSQGGGAGARAIEPVRLELQGWGGGQAQLRALAGAWYSENLQGKHFRNDDMGVDVQFSSEGKREAFATSGNLRAGWRAEMVKVLPDLIKRAVKVSDAAPDARRVHDTKAFHTLVAPLEVNGRVMAAKITLREALLDPNGRPHKFYDVAALEIENGSEMSGVAPGVAAGPVHPTGSEPSGATVAELARAINPKAGGDAPMSSKAAAGSSMGTMTPAQEAAWKRVAQLRTPPTLRERFDTMRANLGTKMRAGILDQFAPIKEVSQEAYMQARLSKGSDGTMEAALLYGRPFLRDGAADVDMKDGGFAQVLASLKGEHDRFLMWVAAQRAERLAAEGKENLFSTEDIGALKTLNAGRFDDGTARTPVYARALKTLNDFNDSVLAMAEQSGLIDPEARALFKDQPYVPFYRVMEEGDMRGPKFSSGLVNQQAFKKLKGGSQQLNADLLENMLMNWSHLYSAAARNRAAQATMDAADKLAIAHQVPEGTKGAVRVMRAGVAEHWAVEDPHLLEAITALNYAPSPLMKPLAVMKNILTYTVTVNPTFKIRNLIRDSLSAISQADLSYNPLKNIADGWKATAADSQIYASMLASGGTIRFGTQESSRLRAQVDKLGGQVLDKDGWRKLADQVRTVWSAYEEFGDRTENVNRAALYEQLVKKGHSHAEAAFMARDLMDFSMAGSWPAIRFLGQTVPFFNARLQGLYKLGRAAAEDPRRFGTMAAAVSLASLGLMAAYQDDDDWKKREDWDRDAYWWFKIGGTAFRIPKPFELGAIGTIAERSAELMLSDEMTGKRFGKRISDMVFGTFAMDPTPQIIKPLLDVYANKDSFTGRAIEGMSDERLRPQDRAGERTTEVARFLGQLGLPDPVQLAKGEYSGLSPKQIDFLLRGYFGWVGTTAAQIGDRALRPLNDRGERPAMELRDAFVAGNFVESLPSGSSRYVTQLYDRAREVDQAYASYRDALKRGDTEKAAQIREEEGDNLLARRRVTHAKEQLAKINQQARMVEASRTLSADEKRQRLDVIEERRDRVARLAASVQ